MASTIPKVVSVEVVPTRPTETDRTMIAQLGAETGRSMAASPYIVKIRLETIPPATGHGWALYVGDTRIPKYWEYPGGIYFKVLDEEFLAEHRGQKLRFTANGKEFIDTGVKLPGPPRGARRGTAAGRLPLQEDVLKESAPARAVRGRPTRKRARPARAKPRRK